MVAYPNAAVLDVTGPLEVFAAASDALRDAGARDAGYTVEIAAPHKGPVAMSSTLQIVADRALRHTRGPFDTLIVAGGAGTREAVFDTTLIGWLVREAPSARRLVSVCSGAFLLAQAGFLDGRRATTHWANWELLARQYPSIEVDPDPIFIKDGNVYTSAGVTSGMDLALALVEEDCGRDLALAVARHLVLFLKRPGGQSQFSARLASQLAEREPLQDVQAWIVEHPADDLRVEALAARAGMSPRNFARVFARELDTTPARFVERARVESARRLLEETSHGVDEVAADCGFGSAETMRRAFLRSVRVSPAAYRSRFQNTELEEATA